MLKFVYNYSSSKMSGVSGEGTLSIDSICVYGFSGSGRGVGVGGFCYRFIGETKHNSE